MSDDNIRERITLTVKKLKLQLARDKLAIARKATDDAQAKPDKLNLDRRNELFDTTAIHQAVADAIEAAGHTVVWVDTPQGWLPTFVAGTITPDRIVANTITSDRIVQRRGRP
jgi:adenylate kinase